MSGGATDVNILNCLITNGLLNFNCQTNQALGSSVPGPNAFGPSVNAFEGGKYLGDSLTFIALPDSGINNGLGPGTQEFLADLRVEGCSAVIGPIGSWNSGEGIVLAGGAQLTSPIGAPFFGFPSYVPFFGFSNLAQPVLQFLSGWQIQQASGGGVDAPLPTWVGGSGVGGPVLFMSLQGFDTLNLNAFPTDPLVTPFGLGAQPTSWANFENPLPFGFQSVDLFPGPGLEVKFASATNPAIANCVTRDSLIFS
jgi:hypothetical protein